jgi:hypothetical protein
VFGRSKHQRTQPSVSATLRERIRRSNFDLIDLPTTPKDLKESTPAAEHDQLEHFQN